MEQHLQEHNSTDQNTQDSSLLSKEAEKTQKILRNSTTKLQKEALQDVVAEIRFLALSWLDDFEKDLFEGKTVGELLDHNKYV